MKRLLLTLMLVVSCKKAPPAPTVTAFADERKLDQWFTRACPLGGRLSSLLHDYTLPPGMHNVHSFTCDRLLTNLLNVHIEIQGDPISVCAVRIGPAEALSAVDPTFIEAWFTDKQLGVRARELLGPGTFGSNYDRMLMLDGIRIAVHQYKSYSSWHFYLVVDGCGHVPDSRPMYSGVY